MKATSGFSPIPLEGVVRPSENPHMPSKSIQISESLSHSYNEGKRAGIKEVLDFIKSLEPEHILYYHHHDIGSCEEDKDDNTHCPLCKWEAKLIEWNSK